MTQRLLPLLVGFMAAVGATEIGLHALPVSTGYDLRAVSAADPVQRGKGHSPYTFSRGWNLQLSNSGVLNNYGFRASYDFTRDPRAIVLIGNSFVQADALDPHDAMAERLGALLGVPAYGIGSDGFSLADYLAAARWAAVEFGSRTLLILLTTGDLKHACTPRLGQHYLRADPDLRADPAARAEASAQADAGDGPLSLSLVDRPAPSTAKRLLDESRLFRYAFDNLRVTSNWEKGWRRNQEQEADPQTAAAVDTGCGSQPDARPAMRYLLQSFKAIEATQRARVIFVLAPAYRKEQGVAAGGARDVDQFADHAAAAGFRVVHLDDDFNAALALGARLDFMPIDGHWNAAANALAAAAAARAVSADARSTHAGVSSSRTSSCVLRSEC